MSNTDFLGRAIDTVKKAIEHDNAGEYEKAYQGYYAALELFMLALKWEKNPKSKEMIRAKTGEYMDRAEKLKNHLANADNKKKPSAVGANGKVANGSGKGCVSCSFLLSPSPLSSYPLKCKPYSLILVMVIGKKTRTAKMQRPKSYEALYKVRFYPRNRTCDGRMLLGWKTQRKP